MTLKTPEGPQRGPSEGTVESETRSPTLCEQIADPLLKLHRRTTSTAAIGVLAVAALSMTGYGMSVGNHHIVWAGVVLIVVSWYGYLLSGCERLLAAREREIAALKKESSRQI